MDGCRAASNYKRGRNQQAFNLSFDDLGRVENKKKEKKKKKTRGLAPRKEISFFWKGVLKQNCGGVFEDGLSYVWSKRK